MPVREFTDSEGIEWRVWDVTADQLHPVTRLEDLLELASGWLAFESETEKRRLPAPFPPDWATMPLPELEELCRRAPPVRRRARSSLEQIAESATAAVDEQRRASDEHRFLSPRGREWTVRLHECLDRAGKPRMVLRFTADDVVVDAEEWPADWRRCTREEYALLLLDANPPRRTGRTGPQRRRTDRPE